MNVKRMRERVTQRECEHEWEWHGRYWTRYRECVHCGEQHDLWRED